ncbi:hypothetical protein XELAEV_18016365mg [Xenopus laevis]|uniref:Uncharacterized protein n=1 Tax=Xenopus laevis TaxID=8355 RepID=A0A974DJV8_XENLA|nr:hypothetical protein XELAEV_18016365mg [Xenopus laevis]
MQPFLWSLTYYCISSIPMSQMEPGLSGTERNSEQLPSEPLDPSEREQFLCLINSKQQILLENMVRCDEMLFHLHQLKDLHADHKNIQSKHSEEKNKITEVENGTDQDKTLTFSPEIEGAESN